MLCVHYGTYIVVSKLWQDVVKPSVSLGEILNIWGALLVTIDMLGIKTF